MRRTAVLLATALAVLLAAATSALAGPPALATAAQGSAALIDFDDDGFEDLAVGAPGENSAAGAVNVLYGSPSGLAGANQTLTRANSEAGDRFGTALAKGDFDGDGITDLAIGAPDEDLGGQADTGVVHLQFGQVQGNGLFGAGFLTQDTTNVPSQAEDGDAFGAALATGGYANQTGVADQLAIGVPSEDVGTTREAGAVTVLRGLVLGSPPSGGQLFTQGRVAGGVADQLDNFGAALA